MKEIIRLDPAVTALGLTLELTVNSSGSISAIAKTFCGQQLIWSKLQKRISQGARKLVRISLDLK